MMGDGAGESDNHPSDSNRALYCWSVTIIGMVCDQILMTEVTILMMVGSLSWGGGLPNFGWWVTLLWEIGDHLREV